MEISGNCSHEMQISLISLSYGNVLTCWLFAPLHHQWIGTSPFSWCGSCLIFSSTCYNLQLEQLHQVLCSYYMGLHRQRLKMMILHRMKSIVFNNYSTRRASLVIITWYPASRSRIIVLLKTKSLITIIYRFSRA